MKLFAAVCLFMFCSGAFAKPKSKRVEQALGTLINQLEHTLEDRQTVSQAPKQLIVISFPGGWHREYYEGQLGADWCEKLVYFLQTYAEAATKIDDDLIIVYPQDTSGTCFDPAEFGHTNARLLVAPTGMELDLWMRDYTTANNIHFKYDPKYLRLRGQVNLGGKDVVDAFKGFLQHYGVWPHITKNDFILDGGNYVSAGNRVVLTKRFIEDNNDYDHPNKDAQQWINKLEQILSDKQLCYFDNPSIASDTTGHSDGLVSFLSKTKVLLPDYDPTDATNYNKRKTALKSCWNDLSIVKMESYDAKKRQVTNKRRSSGKLERLMKALHINKRGGRQQPASVQRFTSATGSTINMAVTDRGIYVPSFESVGTDNSAIVNLIRQHAGSKRVELVDTGELSFLGGSVRCMSWQLSSTSTAAQILLSRSEAASDYLDNSGA